MSAERELLSDYLDGRLGPAEVTAVEQRLAVDADWRSELEAIRLARDVLRTRGWREPPDGFVDELLAVVASDARARVVTLRRSRRVAAIAAAAAAIGLAFALPESTPAPVEPSVQDAADGHVSSAALTGDPVSLFAPAAVETGP